MPSRLIELLFPAAPRRLPCNRGISVACRTLHLLASSLLVGGHAFEVAPDRLLLLLYLTIASGVGLILLELYRSCDWLYQGMGVLVVLKVALTVASALWWEQRVPLLLLVIVLGSVGSHMPSRFRHYSLLHGRVLEASSPPHASRRAPSGWPPE